MRCHNRQPAFGNVGIFYVRQKHHASAAPDFALNLLLKGYFGHFALALFDLGHTFFLDPIPIVSLRAKRDQTHIHQREAAENRRAVQTLVQCGINRNLLRERLTLCLFRVPRIFLFPGRLDQLR